MRQRTRPKTDRLQAAVVVTTTVLVAGAIAFHTVVPLVELLTARGRRPW